MRKKWFRIKICNYITVDSNYGYRLEGDPYNLFVKRKGISQSPLFFIEEALEPLPDEFGDLDEASKKLYLEL